MKFRKRPVVIEAVQWDGSDESWENLKELVKDKSYYQLDLLTGKLRIKTFEGDIFATKGDWIIKGAKGEFYPCKPDIFEQTYEPA
jgi:hypothetical protein